MLQIVIICCGQLMSEIINNDYIRALKLKMLSWTFH